MELPVLLLDGTLQHPAQPLSGISMTYPRVLFVVGFVGSVAAWGVRESLRVTVSREGIAVGGDPVLPWDEMESLAHEEGAEELSFDRIRIMAVKRLTPELWSMFGDAHGMIGGLYALEHLDVPEGVPSHWDAYVQVEDADEVARRVGALGGGVLKAPFDVMDAGRMAVLRDPEGAVFEVWQPKAHAGGALSHRFPGRVCWVELFSRDRERAADFYGALFGWDVHRQKPSDYWTYAHDGIPLGGILDIDRPQFTGVPARWIVYFAVADVDAAVARVKALGGSVHMPAQDLPGAGRFAVCADPQNAGFTLFRLDPGH